MALGITDPGTVCPAPGWIVQGDPAVLPRTSCTGTHARAPSLERPGSAAAVLGASPRYPAAKISCGINAACLCRAWTGLKTRLVREREQFPRAELQSCLPRWSRQRFYSSLETSPVPDQAATAGSGQSPEPSPGAAPPSAPVAAGSATEHRLRAPALPSGHVPRKDARAPLLPLIPLPRGEQPKPPGSGLPRVRADPRHSFAIFFPPSSESRARVLQASMGMSKIDFARFAFSVAEQRSGVLLRDGWKDWSPLGLL